MGETDYLKKFYDSIYFNREELFTEMKNHSQGITEAYFKAKLQSLLDDGEVARVGRNAYCVCKENDKTYSYDYSQEAYDISGGGISGKAGKCETALAYPFQSVCRLSGGIPSGSKKDISGNQCGKRRKKHYPCL